MTTWALIPCSKTKAEVPCAAINMYHRSAQFRGATLVANRQQQQILIISAKYHVLRPETVIAPYDVTLSAVGKSIRQNWAEFTYTGLRVYIQQGDKIVSYLGATYGEFLIPMLRRDGFSVEEPLKGLGQGKRLAWFKERLSA